MHSSFASKFQNILSKTNIILELGCGSGEFLIDLAERFRDKAFYGVDLSSWAVSYANEKAIRRGLRNIKFKTGNMESLDFNDGSFNLVFAIKSFHHSFNPQKASNEAYRVLKIGGYFILEEWAEWARTGVPERYFPESELREILERSGFTVVEFEIIDDEYFVVAKK